MFAGRTPKWGRGKGSIESQGSDEESGRPGLTGRLLNADFHGRKIINLFGRQYSVFLGNTGVLCPQRLIILRAFFPAPHMLWERMGRQSLDADRRKKVLFFGLMPLSGGKLVLRFVLHQGYVFAPGRAEK